LEGRKVIDEFARWQVLNGESIRTWSDRWVPGVVGGMLQASHLASSEVEPYHRVSHLINWEGPDWDLLPVIEHLSPEEKQAILSIPLSSESENDRLVWPYEKSGTFSIRSGYHKIHEAKCGPNLQHSRWSHSVHCDVWNMIWKFNVLPKVKHFVWRAVANVLPSMANLFAKKVTSSPLCPICKCFTIH
jgi:hypothetical protein